MTKNMQAIRVQSRKAVFVRCCLYIIMLDFLLYCGIMYIVCCLNRHTHTAKTGIYNYIGKRKSDA